MSGQMLHIAYSSDNKGALGMGVSIQSLIDSTPGSPITIHVLGKNLTPENRERLRRFAADGRITISYIEMEGRFEDLPLVDHMGPATYYRLALPSLLPADVDRVLYVDIDVIFNRNVTDMYSIDFGDCLVAGVRTTEDITESFIARVKNQLGLEHPFRYINAGVLLMNLDGIRREGMQQDILDFTSRHVSGFDWFDQDVINVVFQDRMLLLHPRWNISDAAIWEIRWEGRERFENNPFPEHELLEAAREPGIIHYWGTPKPWHPGAIRNDGGLFMKAWKRSPWKDQIADVRKRTRTFAYAKARLALVLGKWRRLLANKYR